MLRQNERNIIELLSEMPVVVFLLLKNAAKCMVC